MNKIMELADAWTDELRDIHACGDEHYRAALVSEVERMEAAHQQELAQVKADLKMCQAKNREMLDEIAALQAEADTCGSGAGCLYKVALIDSQAQEIAALREEVKSAYFKGSNDCHAAMMAARSKQ